MNEGRFEFSITYDKNKSNIYVFGGKQEKGNNNEMLN